jgi:LuxR family maltose regulon positive regulatory protein
MNPVLPAVKFLPPSLSNVLDRPRLIQRLMQHQDKRLVLILGQAAQGKSTLVASYLQSSKPAFAWVNLGPEDSDAATLYYVVLQSFLRAGTDMDFSPLLSYPAVSQGPREPLYLYREWVQALFEPITAPVRLVFDGFDRLAPGSTSFLFLQLLLELAPANVGCTMVSREMLPFDLSAAVAKDQVHVLTNKDLAFTTNETRQFFRKVRQIPMDGRQSRKLQEVTEGWVGGLVLISECMTQWAGEREWMDACGKSSANVSSELFAYFGEEIFSRQTHEVRDFLLKSSFLSTIEAGFAEELLGTVNVNATLLDLARRNLFVQSVDEQGRGWVFRYHQMFKDFLQAKAKVEMDEAARHTLLLKAGSLYQQHNRLEEALAKYLEAGAYERAGSVLRQIGLDLLRTGRTGDLARWLGSLPEDQLREEPWLLFYYYMTGRFTGSHDHLLKLQEAHGLFGKQEDLSGLLLSLACLIEASILRGHPSIPPVHALLAKAETLLQGLDPQLHPYSQAVLWLQMGFSYFLRAGTPHQGYQACRNAYLLARDVGDIPLQLNALIQAHGALSSVGRFSEASELIDTADRLFEKHRYPELHALHLINVTYFHSFQGDLERARTVHQRSKEEIDEHHLTYLLTGLKCNDIVLQTGLGAYQEAEDIGDNLTNFALAMGNRFFYGVSLLYRGMSIYQKGEYSRAKEVLETAREVLASDESRADPYLHWTKVALGLASYHLQDYENAERELREAIDYFEKASHYFCLKDAYLAMGLCKWRQGHPDEAAAHLEAAVRTAQQWGCHLFLPLNRDDLLTTATLLLELPVSDAIGYAPRLFAKLPASLTGAELARLTQHGNAQIARSAREIQISIHRATVPRLHIETLGRFRVSRGALAIDENEWQAKQPKLLLKAILARGRRSISKDILIADLWPDHARPAAERNFKVVLHRLRKVLEPESPGGAGSSYIHLKDNRVSLDEELCSVDVEAFADACGQAEAREGGGDDGEALRCGEEALAIYQGDFLPDDLYWPWAELRRAELRREYLKLLCRAAELQVKQPGGHKKAIDLYQRVIQADPLHEPAYRRLMALYADCGRRNAALRLFDACRKALRNELDTEPAEATLATYLQISKVRKPPPVPAGKHPGKAQN